MNKHLRETYIEDLETECDSLKRLIDSQREENETLTGALFNILECDSLVELLTELKIARDLLILTDLGVQRQWTLAKTARLMRQHLKTISPVQENTSGAT